MEYIITFACVFNNPVSEGSVSYFKIQLYCFFSTGEKQEVKYSPPAVHDSDVSILNRVYISSFLRMKVVHGWSKDACAYP